MLKKISAFWQQNKKVIVTVASLTAAAPYLPVLVPLLDVASEQVESVPAVSQPGQSQDEGK